MCDHRFSWHLQYHSLLIVPGCWFPSDNAQLLVQDCFASRANLHPYSPLPTRRHAARSGADPGDRPSCVALCPALTPHVVVVRAASLEVSSLRLPQVSERSLKCSPRWRTELLRFSRTVPHSSVLVFRTSMVGSVVSSPLPRSVNTHSVATCDLYVVLYFHYMCFSS